MRVLVSTSDKTGLLEFLKPLEQKDLELVSTGGTYEFLKKNSFKKNETKNLYSILQGISDLLQPCEY